MRHFSSDLRQLNGQINGFALSGHQLKSESNAEIYGKLLRKGVKCLEIDLWDGPDGDPIVTHGMTLCTSIPLADVVKVIGENAFADSQNLFPVILSLEEHCSLEQQRRAAGIFRETLGEKLLLEPLETGKSYLDALPSPSQLLGKIILKHKKLATPIDSSRAAASEVPPTALAFTSPQEVSGF